MISYRPLWITLLKKDMKRTDLLKDKTISNVTLAKLGKNESVSISTLDRICNVLECNFEDVVEHIQS